MSRYPPCENCGGTKFAEEDGIVTCSRCGRRQEGGLQVGDEEPDFGTQGKVIRKKVEKEKIKVTRTYKGAQAYRLYLEAWQHLLWRQAYTLTHGSVNVSPELWTVARDLWTLQLSKLVHRLDEDNLATNESEVEARPTSTDENADSEKEIIDAGLRPKLWDTITLIFVSALLTRLPITLRKIYELIRAEELPFIRAIRHVPIEMSSRLPPQYKHALDTLTIPAPRDLYQAVWRTLKQFSSDFGMEFPEINWRIILFHWIQHLGLPIEVYITVKDLANHLEYEFRYELPIGSAASHASETRTHRKSPIAMAEVKLMCLMIIATKLLFPFSDIAGRNKAKGHPALRLEWSEWHRIHKNHQESLQHNSTSVNTPAKHIEIRDEDILKLSPDELDSYMDWYQNSFTTSEAVLKTQKTTLEKSILDMFPLRDLPRSPAIEVPDQERRLEELTSQIQNEALKSVLLVEGKGEQRAEEQDSDEDEDENGHQPGSRYPVFPTVESLSFASSSEERANNDVDGESAAALYFHKRAAELVCLDLNRLLKAVRHVERRLEKWIEQKRREEAFGMG